jgi:hypothetical protein
VCAQRGGGGVFSRCVDERSCSLTPPPPHTHTDTHTYMHTRTHCTADAAIDIGDGGAVGEVYGSSGRCCHQDGIHRPRIQPHHSGCGRLCIRLRGTVHSLSLFLSVSFLSLSFFLSLSLSLYLFLSLSLSLSMCVCVCAPPPPPLVTGLSSNQLRVDCIRFSGSRLFLP